MRKIRAVFVFLALSVGLCLGRSFGARKCDRVAHTGSSGTRCRREAQRCGAVFTYDNREHQDGAGSQIQRILCAFAVAKSLGIGYVHSPLLHLGWQGLSAAVDRHDDRAQDKWNDAFRLPDLGNMGCSNDANDTTDGCRHVKVGRAAIEDVRRAHERACVKGGRVVLHSTYPFSLVDEDPSILDRVSFADFLPWLRKEKSRRGAASPLRVAIHVRRGELFVAFSERMLPNAYYVNASLLVSKILNEFSIPHMFEIHTEHVFEPKVVRHLGRDVGTVFPEDDHLEDYDVLRPRTMHLNGDPLKTMQSLATADIFVMSRSSFSYTSALLHKPKSSLVVYHPFWHNARRDWLTVDPSTTAFNEKNYAGFREQIMQRFVHA